MDEQNIHIIISVFISCVPEHIISGNDYIITYSPSAEWKFDTNQRAKVGLFHCVDTQNCMMDFPN